MQSTAIIVGGSGALGRAFISHLNTLNYRTINVDLVPNPTATFNCTPDTAISTLSAVLNSDSPPRPVQLIVNAAGGWVGGSADDSEFDLKCKKMWEMNVESAILAASLGAKYLNQEGLMVFVGAKGVALHDTPDMLAYAMAKSAVGSLAKNLAANSYESSPSVILLLPEVLDTEANRISMPTADFSKWTPVHEIAEKVANFMKLSKNEINGTSWLITTRSNLTEFVALKR